jgi:hypothetical protein
MIIRERKTADERAQEIHELRMNIMKEEHEEKMKLFALERQYLMEYHSARMQAIHYHPQAYGYQQNFTNL